MNGISNNMNLTSFGSAGSQKATNVVKRVATKLMGPTHVGTISSNELKQTKVLVLPTFTAHVKKGGTADKILSFFSKSFREQ